MSTTFTDRYGRQIEVTPLAEETIRRSATRAGIPATAKVTWRCIGGSWTKPCPNDATQTATYDGMNQTARCDEHMAALITELSPR